MQGVESKTYNPKARRNMCSFVLLLDRFCALWYAIGVELILLSQVKLYCVANSKLNNNQPFTISTAVIDSRQTFPYIVSHVIFSEVLFASSLLK